jgi:transposase
MHEQIITIYCLCADFLTLYGHKDDAQAQMSTAEVMTSALVAAWFFQGHQERACLFLKEHAYIPAMLSASRFNRRLHRIPDTCWQALFFLLAQIHQQLNTEGDYIVDSCPVPVCDNLRIRRCKLYRSEDYRGYCASKRGYFYGVKVHLVVTATGKPVDLVLTPGEVNDTPGLRSLFLDLPDGCDLYADKGYTDYTSEDLLAEMGSVKVIAARKSNSKRPHPGHVGYLCQVIRKRVETTFSEIAEHFSRHIHAVTARGFELKVFLTVLAYSILG